MHNTTIQNATIIKPSQFTSMPWRNGLGSTTELIRRDLPGGDDFAWRLSMASVVESGPFSNFSGYDRTLVLLKGTGMTLSYDDSDSDLNILDQPLQMAQFEGGCPTRARLHDGPIEDFNIMTRSSVCRAQTTCGSSESPVSVTTSAEALLVFSVSGELDINCNQISSVSAPAGALVVIEPPAKGLYAIAGAAFIVVEILTH